jgi:mRNA interferase RelE/StbE
VARYEVRYEREAEGDLDYLGRKVEAMVRPGVLKYLADQPLPAVGQRKALDTNPLNAAYRLQLGDYRVYYDVDAEARTVWVLRVGYKRGETLYLLYLRGRPVPMRD